MNGCDQRPSHPIVDSTMTFAEAVSGSSAPDAVLAALRLVEVSYYSFDGKLHQGQLVVHFSVEEDIRKIFSLIQKVRFPLNSVIPIVRYNWSDDASMAANNSSAFNFRFVAGTQKLSCHASALAIDLNPFQNPIIYENGKILPPGAIYRPESPGTMMETSPVVQAFLKHGWFWGGHFHHVRDYHHFEKKTVK